jgi:hypothetical protein
MKPKLPWYGFCQGQYSDIRGIVSKMLFTAHKDEHLPPVPVLDLMPVEEFGVGKGPVADVAGQVLVIWKQIAIIHIYPDHGSTI